MGFLEEAAELPGTELSSRPLFPFLFFFTVPGSLAASKAAKYGECSPPPAPLVTPSPATHHLLPWSPPLPRRPPASKCGAELLLSTEKGYLGDV